MDSQENGGFSERGEVQLGPVCQRRDKQADEERNANALFGREQQKAD